MLAQWRTCIVVAIAGALLTGCFGTSSNVTETGKGLPELTVEFPDSVRAGDVETATLEITNPGPGDIASMVVSFTLVGAAGSARLPEPLVSLASRRSDHAVVEVTPRPTAVSRDGTIYRFDGLEVGESVTISFDIRVPDVDGVAANSVTVYDVQDAERARGVLLRTTVEE